jgi:NADH:flavin oxidoreductases, Old Yellow Enzyme family
MLFSPYTIKKCTFRNRIFSLPNQTHFKGIIQAAYSEAKARGGAAQVTIGETPVTGKYIRQRGAFNFILDDPDEIRFMAETALAITLHGAVASVQLNHPGPYTICYSKDSPAPIGPMGFIRSDGVEVKAMDEDMIEEVVESFGVAAANIKQAGYDMCQVHTGHGWLLGQFLSGHFNQRTDKYGGSLENRARLAMAVYDRIRKKCGPDFLIEIRVSGDELVPGGMKTDEVIEFLKMAEGKIDLVNVSVGVHQSRETAYRMFPQTSFTEHGVNVPYAAAIKKAINIPVIATGGISDPEHAEQILQLGQADFIGMARALIADPDLPKKARSGRRNEIIPCLRCTNCMLGLGINDTVCCAVNPQTGRELQWQTAPRPAASRKVVVVGGGPAGMKAAVTAVERGHDVTLIEKSNELGGMLKISDYDTFKDDMKRFKDYLVNRTMSLAKVRLNTEATPELVRELAPDVLIAAVGAAPAYPEIPGIRGENVMTAVTAFADASKIGKKVVIIGGGMVGCETGLFLADLGKEVMIVEMMDAIGDPVNWRNNLPLVAKMDETSNLNYETGLKCLEIKLSGIKVAVKDGSEKFICADTVVLSAGMKPESDTVDRLRDCAPEFYSIGDCVKPGKIMQAMQGGYFTALDIL